MITEQQRLEVEAIVVENLPRAKFDVVEWQWG